MVNIIIYLKKEHDAEKLVRFLLTEKLIATASIDEDNISYNFENNELRENVHSVITAQSKALLFNKIVETIEKNYSEKIPINAIPIISSNNSFNELINNRTIKIDKI
jgi:uncharacterized protein involved in tolerance to divalent cations